MFNFHQTGDMPCSAELISFRYGLPQKLVREAPSIVFVNQHSISVFFDSFEGKKNINQGQFFLLPSAISCYIRVEEDTELIFLQIPNMALLYLQYITPYIKENKYDLKNLFYPMEMSPLIELFAENIRQYWTQERNSNILMEIKSHELFHLLNHCYTKIDLWEFFSPILNDEYTFALFVMENYDFHMTAQELSNRSNYSISHFERLFRKTFGVSPYKWMLRKKINNIHLDLMDSKKPFKIIADKYGFASLSNLGDFCRKHLGQSPTVIRKNNAQE